MLLVPVGFVSDHVEILYDIDVLFRDYGKARGVAVRRSESLNDSPEFAAALASLVTARIEKVSGVEVLRCQVLVLLTPDTMRYGAYPLDTLQ